MKESIPVESNETIIWPEWVKEEITNERRTTEESN